MKSHSPTRNRTSARIGKRLIAPVISGPSLTSPKPSPAASPPSPMTGESQSQFFRRAMRALRRRIPSINRRTLAVLKIWTASRNDCELRQKAIEQFPATTFVHAGPRCVFVEHTVPANGSQPEIRYGQEELQQLVDWANYRIRNAGNFAAISDGHTPSQAEKAKGIRDPDVLGYAGPFYLGLLGDVDPRWAIYADEWVHQQDLPRFARLQRRSPEVWANEPMASRTIDPIAALGAATPRLDSGMNPYCRCSDGRLVMRYSAMAFPGPFNTFTQSSTRTKSRYSGDSAMPLPGDNTPPIDLAAAIGEAIQAILPTIVQAVLDRLNNGDGETPPPEDQPDDEALTEPTGDPLAEESVEPTDDASPHHYRALGSRYDTSYRVGQRESNRSGRSLEQDGLPVIVARQSREIQKLKDEITRERRDVSRYSRLSDLSREFAFDARDEFETCIDMTDAQFDRHCAKTVTKYSRRDEVGYLELPEAGSPQHYGRSGLARVSAAQIERFSREAASIAARKNATQGGSTTFETEFDAICKQHGVSV